MPSPSLLSLPGVERRVVVGVGDIATSNNQSFLLATYSLGSCLGITIYDPVSRVGGLLHAMLPDSSINPQKAVEQPAMFVDTGVPALFRAVYQLKGEKHRVQICVAGGAQLMDPSGFFNIGQRNYECFKTLLHDHGLSIRAEQIGGLVSRTIHLNLGTGEVRLKASGQSREETLFGG